MAEKSDASERRSKLSAAKRAVLEKRLRDAMTPHAEQQSIQRRPDQDVFPLSFAQERFWFLDQLNPGSPAYNTPMALRLTGSLDMTALEQALNEILHRHEVLRATFANVEGRPVQVIAPAQPLHLPVVDLSELPPGERKSQAMRLATEETQRPIDLARGPLLRATLLHLNEEEHILLLVIHHLVFDAWAAQVITKELAVLYEAFSAGHPSPLSELPIQYADFAHWQRQWLQSETMETQLSYWKEQLDGAPPVLKLPTDHPRPAFQIQRGSKESVLLSAELSKELKALSRREGVTLFTSLLAAFKTLLYRYTGQEDIVVGFPIAGRTRVETEGLIGLFINTLVLRIDLSGNPTFRELLDQVQETALAAYAHQDIPFEKLVEELQPERDMSQTPLFQVMFNFKNFPKEAAEVQSLSIEEFEFDRGTAMFDLAFEIVEKDAGLSCRLLYSTRLFERTTITRVLGHYLTLLKGIVADPDQRIRNLPLLTAAERHQMLVEWNDIKVDYPKDSCIHQLFEAQVQQTPDATAVVFEDQQLTYRELNDRANQLAHHLQKLGVGPEVLVGICLERSLEMVVGLLGILKAGGAYVPLDPEYPGERLSFMLSDIKAPVLVTQEHLGTKISEYNAETVFLDSCWGVIEREKKENLSNETTTENLAYVIYTSGSTGTPRGVMISHHNVVALLHSFKQVTLEGKKRIGTSVAAFSFDVSVEEIFSSLCFGGTVHIVRPEHSTNVEYFAKYIIDNHITIAYILPNFLPGIASHLKGKTDGVHLKCVITGLAPKKESVLQSMRNVSHQIRLLNAYGPTEVTYGATAYEFLHADEPDRDVPIGRPFPNYEVYIVDSNLEPVPIGVVGELLIGGVGLARGYLNHPELTAEKFIPHPFRDQPGERVYRTGDLCRFLPDGNIDFIGRFDHQVKMRGFRIELGEIEAVLRQHPDVQNAVASAREDRPGDRRLVSYFVPKQGTALTINILRDFLKEKLPNYMIPSVFMMLDVLPLTPNGKVDRNALPVPDTTRPDLEETYRAPRTPAEKRLSEIWAEVLGLEKIGIHDNFFELGGHSLLATQVVSRLYSAFGRELSLRSFFESPTIAQMALLITRKQAEQVDKEEIEKVLDELEALSD